MRNIRFLALMLLLSTGLLAQKMMDGELTGDERLNRKGYPADEYTIKIKERRILNIWLNSNDFDAYLIVESEDGTVYYNDDTEGNNSYLSIIAEPGVYNIWAGAYNASIEFDESMTEARGLYELLYEKGSEVKVSTIKGRLDDADPQLPKGEYYDVIPYNINPRGHFQIRLKGYGFSGFLFIESPSGKVYRSNDFERSEMAGFVNVTNIAPERGTWNLTVSSDILGYMGGYDLEILDLGPDSNEGNKTDPIELE